MTALLNFREAVEKIYAKYDVYVISIWKFLLALISFLLINGRLGYFEKLDSIFVVLILALFCSFMPVNTIVLLGAAMILGHLYGLSLPALIVGGGILIILLLLYMGTITQMGYVLVLTMVALAAGVPGMVPLVFGLLCGPAAIAAIWFGTAAYYVLEAVDGAAQAGTAAGGATAAEESQAIVENVKGLLESISQENQMVLVMISLAAAFLVVWLIRKMAVKRAWTLGILMGTLTFLVVDLLGCVVFGEAGKIPGILIGTVVSVGIAFCVKFFRFHADVSRTMQVQFEDRDYYYYVKAIPKRKKGSEASGGN